MDLYCLVFVGAADWISHANVFLSKNVFMSAMQISYKSKNLLQNENQF